MKALAPWAFWAGMIAAFSLGLTLVIAPRQPEPFFFGLCMLLDVAGVVIWKLRSRPLRRAG